MNIIEKVRERGEMDTMMENKNGKPVKSAKNLKLFCRLISN